MKFLEGKYQYLKKIFLLYLILNVLYIIFVVFGTWYLLYLILNEAGRVTWKYAYTVPLMYGGKVF